MTNLKEPSGPELLAFYNGLRQALRRFDADTYSPNELVAAIRWELAALQEAEPAAAEGQAGWISVQDRLPEKFDEVLIAFKGSSLPATGQYTGNKRDSEDGWCYPSENSGDDTDWTVTHWMPLPAAPLPSGQQEGGKG